MSRTEGQINSFIENKQRELAREIEAFSGRKVQEMTFQVVLTTQDDKKPRVSVGSTEAASNELREIMLNQALAVLKK